LVSSDQGLQVTRREFISLLGSVGAAWLTASAQQGERVRRVGVLLAAAADDPEYQARLAALTQALTQLGWSEGKSSD
jgi:putative ABC transport system substrate-binding protein